MAENVVQLGALDFLPLKGSIGDVTLSLGPKTFKSGSTGWYWGGKVMIGGRKCQASVIVTVVGTKPGTNGEQKGTTPEIAQDAPETAPTPLFDEQPAKPRRKRS